MSTKDYAQLQAVLDQLVEKELLKRGKKNGNGSKVTPIELGKRVIISDTETNDIHVDVNCITIHPFYFTLGQRGNPMQVVARAVDLSLEFDEERRRRTQHAINHLKWQLRLTIQQLGQLDPGALDQIIEEEYFGEGEGEELGDDERIELDEVSNG